MTLLKDLWNLIIENENTLDGFYEKYPNIAELKDSDEYKIYKAKSEAYRKAFDIASEQLRALERIVSDMNSLR